MTTKAPEAFRTIGEVSDLLATPAHVLRFWESRFPQIKPVKRAGGRRYYRPTDVALLGGIKRLLHDDGMTIRGVQKLLRDHGVRHVCAMAPAPEDASDAAPQAPRTDPSGAPERDMARQAAAASDGTAPENVAPDIPAPAIPTPDIPAPDGAAPDSPRVLPPAPTPRDTAAPRRAVTRLRGLEGVDAGRAADLLGRCSALAARLRTHHGTAGT